MLKKAPIRILLGAATLLGTAAHAALPGFYANAQLGYANTHMKELSVDNSGIAGRLAAGYQFNQNIATEAGFLYLKKKSLQIDTEPTNLKQYAFDVTGKGILPLERNISLYGKLGLAYLKLSGYNKTDSMQLTRVMPEIGLGVSYEIPTSDVVVDAAWTHLHPVGGNKLSFPKAVDFFALGFSYHFG